MNTPASPAPQREERPAAERATCGSSPPRWPHDCLPGRVSSHPSRSVRDGFNLSQGVVSAPVVGHTDDPDDSEAPAVAHGELVANGPVRDDRLELATPSPSRLSRNGSGSRSLTDHRNKGTRDQGRELGGSQLVRDFVRLDREHRPTDRVGRRAAEPSGIVLAVRERREVVPQGDGHRPGLFLVNEDVAADKTVEFLNLACRLPERLGGIISPVRRNLVACDARLHRPEQ